MADFGSLSSTAAYGMAHQQQVAASGRWVNSDAMATTANNPFMALGSQFGEGGQAIAGIAQLLAMQNSTLGPLMQRFAFPSGTDLAAVARNRQYQITAGMMGMQGTAAPILGLFGIQQGTPEYNRWSMMPMMVDQMTGGMATKFAHLLDENLFTVQGGMAVADAASWRSTMGLLDPQRAAFLQQSLQSRTRMNTKGEAFRPGTEDDFNAFKLRNVDVTAGLNNDEFAQAVLFAERNGIRDDDTTAALLKPGSQLRAITAAQLKKYRAAQGIKGDPTAADIDAAQMEVARNEGLIGGGTLVAQGIRQIRNSLMPTAGVSEVMGFMEQEGIHLRGKGDMAQLQDTVMQLQALGRAAAMSTEAMMKGAQALNHQFGGGAMYQANALALGQSSERLFRLGADAGGYHYNTRLTERDSSQVAEGLAGFPSAPGYAVMAALNAEGRGAEIVAAQRAGNLPDFLRKSMANPAIAASAARASQLDKDVLMQEFRKDNNITAGDFAANFAGQVVAESLGIELAQGRYERANGGIIEGAGLTRAIGGMNAAQIRALEALGRGGDAAHINGAGAAAGLLGIDPSEYRGLNVRTGGALQRLVSMRGAGYAYEADAANRQQFVASGKAALALASLIPGSQTATTFISKLMDGQSDLIGSYTKGGLADGLSSMMTDMGILVGADKADIINKVHSMAPDELNKLQSTLTGYAGAMGDYMNSARFGGNPDELNAKRQAFRKIATELEASYGIKTPNSMSMQDDIKGAMGTSILEDVGSKIRGGIQGAMKWWSELGAPPGAPNSDKAPSADRVKEVTKIELNVRLDDRLAASQAPISAGDPSVKMRVNAENGDRLS